MAPTSTSEMIYCNDHLTLTNKLRKPVVEKLRRDRINSSIEELKSLLGAEILNQQSDSKLEKADILEMTVCYLRGMVESMSKDEVKAQSQRRLLSHFQSRQPSSDNRRDSDLPQLSSPVQHSISKEKSPVNSVLWRPW